jgi:hypothetical protein
MDKDGSSNSTGKDAELDAFLSATDRGMLEAIRDNLDLGTGFAQILDDLAAATPAGRPARPAQAEAGGHAHGHGHAPGPVRACEVPGPARKIPSLSVPATRKEPRYHHKALTTLALAVITALNIALLCSLSHNHGAAGAQSGVSVTSPKPTAGEPARDYRDVPPPTPRLILLGSKTGAPVSLRFVADNAGIGGDPVISYLKNSASGPVLLLSGFPAGTAISYLSTGADQSCRTCSAVSGRNRPFPSGGQQLSPGATICITGDNGRVMLKTVQNQHSAQIGVIVTWFPDLMRT